MPTPKQPYKGTAAQMLTIMANGWYHAEQHQSVLEAEDTTYTMVYITAKQAEVLTCQSMPPLPLRLQARETLHAALDTDLVTILAKMRSFKSYVTNGVTNPVLRAIAITAMGYDLYPQAENGDWDIVKTMLMMANIYGAANSAMLLALGGMPTNFLTTLTTLTATFNTHYADFLAETAACLVATETRNTALKNIYLDTIKMFKTAQRLNLTPPTKKEFNYAYQLQLISSGPTGTKGIIYDLATGLPIAGVKVEIPSKNIMVFTAADGTYQINVAHGNYGIKLTPPSGTPYQPLTDTIIVLVNTMSTRDFFMYT